MFMTAHLQLYDPYTDNPGTKGFMRIPPEVLNDVIPRFMKDGWQVVRLTPLDEPIQVADSHSVRRMFTLSETAPTVLFSMHSKLHCSTQTSRRSARAWSTHNCLPSETWRASAPSVVGRPSSRLSQGLTKSMKHDTVIASVQPTHAYVLPALSYR